MDEQGSEFSFRLAAHAKNSAVPYFIITPDLRTLYRLQNEMQFFYPDLPISILPDWETLPYDPFSPSADIVSERLATLYTLPSLKSGIILSASHTALQRLAPMAWITANHFSLKRGDILDLTTFRQRLETQGYYAVREVKMAGEFAVRGSLIDIYPMGALSPYRLDLFDKQIDTIRSFDAETQRSLSPLEKIECLPRHEFPFNETSVAVFRRRWNEFFLFNPVECPLYQSISQSRPSGGMEYYLPLFFEKLDTIFDYLPLTTQIIQINDVQKSIEVHQKHIFSRYESYRHDRKRPLLPPESLWLDEQEWNKKLSHFSHKALWWKDFVWPQSAPETPLEDRFTVLTQLLKKTPSRIILSAASEGRSEMLLKKLSTFNDAPKVYFDWESCFKDSAPIGILTAPLEQGMQLSSPNLILITETELYQKSRSLLPVRKKISRDPVSFIQTVQTLEEGNFVVHRDHGIGVYRGLKLINHEGWEAEYVLIEYADQNKLYIPITDLHLLQKYIGENEDPPLDTLGSSRWKQEREKASRRIQDVAAELLAIQAKRGAQSGYAYDRPDQDYFKFVQAFPFEDTPDQAKAIEAVIQDMTRPHPMDRLICGDVGFGKTEIALRAACLAIQNKKQVAVLVPTTLLAQQHFETFSDRFAETGAIIECFSRLKTLKEEKIIAENCASGRIDIVIGTHKLLQPSLHFLNLGLIIIDEEHRFGVKQKEHFKALRSTVDILTLTATPIPRTLNLVFSDIRDISLISTPPAKRLAIKTFLHEYSPSLIQEAVHRELMRGGQVYYLHNAVHSIAACESRLREWFPEVPLAVAHGAMRAQELEKIMSAFYHQRFSILICTTIIESGIDIPNANTIIIERADKLGLAQLHQLRGRVGRSFHQAYAYLFIPSRAAITPDAEKRLETIIQLDTLGAGMSLALRDLEIRGAGDFLGEKQSGHVQKIGLNLYLELLKRAVDSIRSGQSFDAENPFVELLSIDLGISALIPEFYIEDVYTRLKFYQRLVQSQRQVDLDDLKIEIMDRFGSLPEPVKNLFSILKVKLQAHPLDIQKIGMDDQKGYVLFKENPNVNIKKILQLIQAEPAVYSLKGSHTLQFFSPQRLNDKERIAYISALLIKLT